jgi:two-component system phosphate regulon sensor histidine kinase PhoR
MIKIKPFMIVYTIFFFAVSLMLLWLVPQSQLWITMWWVTHSGIVLLFILVKKIRPMQSDNLQGQSPTQANQQPSLISIFNQLDHYVMIVRLDGEITYLTPAWIELFDPLIKTKTSVNVLMVAPTLWGSINQGIATEKATQFEWEYKQKNFRSVLSPLMLHDQFYGVMISAIDITKALQIEKIQSDFLADISHEIKTPLSAILGASEILNQRDRKLTPKQQQEFQEMIAMESARLKRLIIELTDLSRIGTHGFQTLIKTKFSFYDLVIELMKVYQIDLANKPIKMNIEVSPNLEVFADRDKFFLIMSNLLSNAIRYTDKGTITIQGELRNQSIIIQVKDSGQGIEPNQLERIFDRFYRTDAARSRVQGGTGLGLAITRAIIQAHQGTIQAKSQLHKGTVFIITLPHLH